MFGGFPRVVQPVLGKFDRKTVKRAFVKPRYKTLNNLFRNKFKRVKLLDPV
jgi:hypothetical protein